MSLPRVVVLREQLEDRELANYLPLRDRFDLSLVTTRRPGPYASTGLGVPVRTASRRFELAGGPDVQRLAARAIGRWVDTDRLRALPRLLTSCDVAIVNECHMVSSAQVGELRARRRDLRVVTVCYENIPFRYEDDERLAHRKDVVRSASDAFVALTPEARDALIEEGVAPQLIALQPYGVDPGRFGAHRRSAEIRSRWGASDHDVVVLFTGRLVQEKGLLNLVRAVARLADPRILLVVVGTGPEHRRLERAARALGAKRLVREPWMDSDAIPVAVASADILALPSVPTPYWEEQLGFSALEAMASAIPVLAVRNGSLGYVVGEGGLLADPYDVDSLTAALASLVDSQQVRAAMGAAGRRRVDRIFNTTAASEGLASVIEKVLDA